MLININIEPLPDATHLNHVRIAFGHNCFDYSVLDGSSIHISTTDIPGIIGDTKISSWFTSLAILSAFNLNAKIQST